MSSSNNDAALQAPSEASTHSHGIQEQQQQQQQHQQQQQAGDDGTRGKSTRLCRHFTRGRCTWGDQCRFSHDASQQQQDNGVDNSGSTGMNGGHHSAAGSGQAGGSLPPRSSQATGPFSPPPQQQGTSVSVGGANAMGAGAPPANAAWIGQQQLQLQQQRNAILMAAIAGQFVFTTDSGGRASHVRLPQLGGTDVPVKLLDDRQLAAELASMERDQKIRDGGLHYLVGEPSIFWSMMRSLHAEGTTHSALWDQLLQRAIHGSVSCMFFHSAAGCLAPRCPFEHAKSSSTQPALMALATSNAMLTQVPGLYGPAATTSTGHTTSAHGGGASNGGPNPHAAPFHFSPRTAQSPDAGFVSIAGGGGITGGGGGAQLSHPHSSSSNGGVGGGGATGSLSAQPSQSNHWACISGTAVLGSTSHMASLLAGGGPKLDGGNSNSPSGVGSPTPAGFPWMFANPDGGSSW